MNNETFASGNIDRRSFVKTLGCTAAAAALTPAWSGLAQESAKTITLGFVGCAHIHTPSFVRLLAKERKDVKVKYVWDHNATRAEKRAAELGAKVVADPKEIYGDGDVAGVVICSETTRHRELVLGAAAARKHMFVEKPLGITARESYAMATAIEKAGLLFTTGYFMRTQAPHLFLKEQIQAGAFGQITRVRGSNCHSGSLGGWFDDKPDDPANNWRWMADPKIAGVGAFGDLGTHSLDILMWLLGDIAAVTADIQVVTKRYGNTDETGEALIKFKSGVVATLAAGWVDVDNPVSLLISGTEGHATIINGELFFNCRKVKGADGKKPWKDFAPTPPLPLHQFVNAIAGDKTMPLVTPKEAAARVAVMEAAYRGAKSRSWIKPA